MWVPGRWLPWLTPRWVGHWVSPSWDLPHLRVLRTLLSAQRAPLSDPPLQHPGFRALSLAHISHAL